MTNTRSRPVEARPDPLTWLRQNLFNNWWNSLLTVFSLWLVYALGGGISVWAFTEANWRVIPVNLRLFLVGQYPLTEIWRIWFLVALLALLTGSALAIWAASYRRIAVGFALTPLLLALLPFSLANRLWLASLTLLGLLGWFMARNANLSMRRLVMWGGVLWVPVSVLIMSGLGDENPFLPSVGTNLWGGLLLTMLLTIVGIAISFPLGVLLALGRRSDLPIIRWASVAYIELIRGVPLITLLFMAQLMLPLFLPANVSIDRVLRAQVGIILFSAAYLAENVRGGLQAIPKGQFEASYALGLSGVQTTLLIILPQALRIAIPVLVGQFIGLLKDTSLVAIVGLFDLLGIAKTVLAQPEFLGLQREVYAFISVFYWLLSYGMSYISQRLESALGLGQR